MRPSKLWVVPPLAGVVLWIACGVPESEPYLARQYEADANCLGPGRPIDVVNLADGGSVLEGGVCDAICITDTDGDIYVSVQCPPYPTAYDLKGNAPACASALAAQCRLCPVAALEAGLQIVCDAGAPVDAGSKDGDVEGGDAGVDAPTKDSGLDAGSDAPAGS